MFFTVSHLVHFFFAPTQHMKSKWVEIFRGKAAVGRRIAASPEIGSPAENYGDHGIYPLGP